MPLDPLTKRVQILAKLSEAGRFEVRFRVEKDGSVTYVTLENGRTTFTGRLPTLKAAEESWNRLVERGYVHEPGNF